MVVIRSNTLCLLLPVALFIATAATVGEALQCCSPPPVRLIEGPTCLGAHDFNIFDGSLTGDLSDEEDDDLSSPLVIAQKLGGLVSTASSKLGEEASDLDFSLLSSLHLTKAERAKARDTLFRSSGRPGKEEDLAGIDEALDLAGFAHCEDTAELKQCLEEARFRLLKHNPAPASAGSVGYYIAICPERRVAVVGVKGTSTLKDVMTDSCGQAVTHELDEFLGRKARCHEGMLISAKRLSEEVEPFVRDLFLPLGYRTLIAGHSLGAGTGSLLGMILCSRIPSLLAKHRWGWRGIRRKIGRLLKKKSRADISCLFERGGKLHVVAFATPPVLDCDSALACEGLVTSVVNDVDIVPRLSVANLLILVRALNELNAKVQSDEESSIVTAKGLTELEEDALETVELRDPDHLYVPGRVLFMFKNHTEAFARSAARDSPEEDISLEKDFVVSDGTNKALRMIEMDKNMITDHYLRTSYRNSVDDLLSKPF